MNSRTTLAILWLAVMVIAPTAPVEACGGAGVVTSAAAFRYAATVFIGAVEELSGEVPRLRATFAVHKTYRGHVEPRVIVASDCGMTFVRDATYVIYASEHDGQLRTSPFMRSRPIP